MNESARIVKNASKNQLVVPAFNIAHLPMVEPVVGAVVDEDVFAFLEVARLDWEKMGAESPTAAAEEFYSHQAPDYVRLHLDHIPVIDEDDLRVDWQPLFGEAIDAGFHSLMIDASRLDFEGNAEMTRRAAQIAHAANLPLEAELGSVFGHEEGPRPSYEELFETGRGFTDADEASRFVEQTDCDWLSVAVGTVHGAISGAQRDEEKVEARIDLDHLQTLRDATGVPLVLHGGSSVKQQMLLDALGLGIAKVNIATEIRQAYEFTLRDTDDPAAAQEAVYDRTRWLLSDYLKLSGSRDEVAPG